MKKKVTIELTPAQKKQIKDETGKELNTLEFDALEDRDAPKTMRRSIDDPDLVGPR